MGVSCTIGWLKFRHDETKQYKELKKVNEISRRFGQNRYAMKAVNDVCRVSNECITARNGIVRADNCCSVNNAATTVVKFERRKRR